MRDRVLAMLGSAAVATVMACSAATVPAGRLPDGPWGGRDMGMVVTDTGASIQFDCAAGAITGALQIAEGGGFDWSGTFQPGHGGPAPIGGSTDGHAARYTGRVVRDRMTITLTLPDTVFTPRTYVLTRGGNANVLKCL